MGFFPSLLSTPHMYVYMPLPTCFSGHFQERFMEERSYHQERKKFSHPQWVKEDPQRKQLIILITSTLDTFLSWSILMMLFFILYCISIFYYLQSIIISYNFFIICNEFFNQLVQLIITKKIYSFCLVLNVSIYINLCKKYVRILCI